MDKSGRTTTRMNALKHAPTYSRYLNESFKRHVYSLTRTYMPNYFEIHTYRSYGPDKSGRTDTCKHIHRTDIVAWRLCMAYRKRVQQKPSSIFCYRGHICYEGHSKSFKPFHERRFRKIILLRLRTITSCRTMTSITDICLLFSLQVKPSIEVKGV